MRRADILILLAGLVFLGSSAGAAGPHRHAVVIGINDYADAGIPDLKYAESDAKAVYATLTDPRVGRFSKANVTLLLGRQVTPSAIKAALYGLRGVGKDDLVIIFYSGHGAKEGDEAFWVTQNAQAKALPATALSNADIRKYLAMIPSQKLVTFLDCCYAASTVKKSLGDPGKLFGEFPGKGRVTIAGSADSQEALEMPEAKAGVFTHFLVQALSGKADTNEDGAVTFEEVWSYLGENVRKASVKQGGLHEPVLISESGVTPQFLLTYNPAAKAANEKSLAVLRKLFDESKITGAQYDAGRKALTAPAIDAASRARREVFADLVAGRLSPKYLQGVLNRRLKETKDPVKPRVGKPTLAVVPFTVLGNVPGKDQGKILAELLLPRFTAKYELIDQAQLARFCDQDDLTIAGLVEQVKRPTTKGLSKAVKLRAVHYLVVGTIAGSPDGTLTVTARICDWQRGTAVGNRFAQIRADNWTTLQDHIPRLAEQLGGKAETKTGPHDSPEALLRYLYDAIEAKDAAKIAESFHPSLALEVKSFGAIFVRLETYYQKMRTIARKTFSRKDWEQFDQEMNPSRLWLYVNMLCPLHALTPYGSKAIDWDHVKIETRAGKATVSYQGKQISLVSELELLEHNGKWYFDIVSQEDKKRFIKSTSEFSMMYFRMVKCADTLVRGFEKGHIRSYDDYKRAYSEYWKKHAAP